MATIQIRGVNPEIKSKAEMVFRQLGISNSAAIKLYFNQVAVTGKIPFSPTTVTENGFTTQQEDKILEAWDSPEEKEFNSMEELVEDLHS